MSTEGPGKKREYHPEAKTAEEIDMAHTIASSMVAIAGDTDQTILNVCREMSLGQLAHQLNNLETALPRSERDRAIAEAFLEKYQKPIVN